MGCCSLARCWLHAFAVADKSDFALSFKTCNRLRALGLARGALLFAAWFSLFVPASRAQFIQGFDAYSGDGAINWTTAKNAGIQFAFVKATEGVNFVDSRFTANMQGATAAGVYIGTYHICRVDSKNGVPFTSYNGQPFAVGSDMWLDATSEAVDYIEAIRPYYFSGVSRGRQIY